MTDELRQMEIPVVGDVPWGSHFCHFYETTTDLLDTLVPYFKAGLDNNEFCIWVFSEPLTATEAIGALRAVVPPIDRHLSNRDIVIVSHSDWYQRGGDFSSQAVLNGWRQEVDKALARGYAGIRVTGNLVWENQSEWSNLAQYERAVQESINELRMRALCTYALGKCGANQILDVVGTHQFALAKRNGELEIVEPAETKKAKAEIERLNRELEGRVIERTAELATAYEELRKESVERRRTESELEQLLVREQKARLEAEVMRDANLALTQDLSLQRVLETILEYLQRIVPYDTANVMLVEEDSKFVVTAMAGYEEFHSHVIGAEPTVFDPKSNALFERICAMGKALLVADTKDEPAWQSVPINEHVRNWIGIPLVAYGKTIGLYSLDKSQPGYFTDEHVRLAELLAVPAASAIQNARLFRQGRRYSGELERRMIERRKADTRSAAFATLARKLSGAIVPLDAAKIIADTADELFGWDSCSINLYDADRDLVQPVLRIDTIDEQRVDVTSSVTEGKPSARCRRLIQQIAGLTLREEPCKFDEDSIPFGDTTRPSAAIMDVPIRHLSEVIGTLSVQSYTPQSYDAEALNNLQSLADHCGEALNRIRAEQALRESEERYRDLIENSQDLFCTHDLEGRLLSANRAVEKLLGYALHEFKGKNFREILVPEVRDQFDDYLNRIRKEGVASGRMLVQTRAGEQRIWEYYNTLRTEGVAAPIVRGMARDITERKRAEDALRESESFRRTIIDSEPECVKIVAPDCTLLDMNPAGLAMIGASCREDVVGTSVLRLIAPDSRHAFTEMHERVCQGDSVVGEFEMIGLNGTRRLMETHAAPLRNRDSEVIAQLAITRDVTERKRAERSLKLFRTLIDQSSDAIEVIDQQTLRFIDCNQSAYQTLGYSREEFLSLTIYDIDPAIDSSILARLDEEMRKSGSATMESIHRRKDGSTFPVEVNVKVVGLERDYRLAVVRDITSRKASEEALRQAEQKYRDIFENAGEGIFQSTRDGRFLTANPALARMLGYASAEELIRNRVDIEHQHYVDPLKRQEFRRLADEYGFIRDFEYQAYRKDGSKLWITTNVRAVRDEDGTLLYYEGTAQDITARKQAEEARTRLAAIVESSDDGIIGKDLNGTIVSWNAGAERIYGYSAEEIIGKPIAILVPVEGVDDIAQIGERVSVGESINHYETVGLRKDGQLINVSLTISPIPDPANRIVGSSTIARDITDRKRAEETLRENKELFRSAIDYAAIGMALVSPDGRWLRVNRSLCELVGYTEEELLATNFQAITHPDDLVRDLEYIRQMLANEIRSYQMEKRYFHKLGHIVWILLSVSLLRDSQGNPRYFVSQIQDITEQKQAAEALREAEQKYRELFENAKDAIYVHDLQGRYTSVNPAAEVLSGYSRDEILGRPFTDFVAPEYLKPVREHLCRKLNEAGETTYEIDVIAKDGRRVPVEVSSRLIRRNGEPVGVQGTARDVTERKRAQEAMRSYSRRLIEAQEAERQNIARELHDEIGQVLTAVRINLQSAQRSSGTGIYLPRIEDSIVVVDEALKRVRELSLQLRPSLLDDLGLTAALRWYADRYAQRTGFAVEIQSDCEQGGRLHRDLETACFRIAQEALTNIARHTEATRVAVELKCAEGTLLLVIKDNGVGFDIDPLFKNATAGTALGLRGMEERALAVGGHLEINSAPGQGTEVRVTLPLRRTR